MKRFGALVCIISRISLCSWFSVSVYIFLFYRIVFGLCALGLTLGVSVLDTRLPYTAIHCSSERQQPMPVP